MDKFWCKDVALQRFLIKNGDMLQVPIDELEEFLANNRDRIQQQKKIKRRTKVGILNN